LSIEIEIKDSTSLLQTNPYVELNYLLMIKQNNIKIKQTKVQEERRESLTTTEVLT